MPKKSDKSDKRFSRYHNFKIEQSDWTRAFFTKRLKTEFSQTNKRCNMIFNHTKHVLNKLQPNVITKFRDTDKKADFGPFLA